MGNQLAFMCADLFAASSHIDEAVRACRRYASHCSILAANPRVGNCFSGLVRMRGASLGLRPPKRAKARFGEREKRGCGEGASLRLRPPKRGGEMEPGPLSAGRRRIFRVHRCGNGWHSVKAPRGGRRTPTSSGPRTPPMVFPYGRVAVREQRRGSAPQTWRMRSRHQGPHGAGGLFRGAVGLRSERVRARRRLGGWVYGTIGTQSGIPWNIIEKAPPQQLSDHQPHSLRRSPSPVE